MLSDAALLEAWRAGDADAGDRLFRAHFARVRRFFRNKVPAPEVEDLIQATFEACHAHGQQYRGEARFQAYLLAIARSQLHRWLRLREPSRGAAELEASSIAELGVSPSSVAAAGQRQQLVMVALQRLPVEHQTLLELFYWDDLSGPEIAEIMGIDPTTVRTRLHRARARLRELLAAELGLADLEAIEREARLLGALLDGR